jgi:hypothetical protein
LKSVDFPTLGSPTIPHLSAIESYYYKVNTIIKF